MKPNQPGASHNHTFFGNVTTNAGSTYESLRATPATTCEPNGDTAAYWVPTLSVNGQAVAPRGASFYYFSNGPDFNAIQAFPAGLKVVAGDAMATTAQDRRVTSWGCSNGDTTETVGEPPTCPPGTQLVLHVRFPECWDGVNLDSADHKSHMAYKDRRTCPPDHPVQVPRLKFFIRYPIQGGPGVTLASMNSPLTGHADFFNAWDQGVLEQRVQTCLRGGLICGPNSLSEAP